MADHNLWGFLAQARYDDLRREADAARLAAAAERGANLRLRLGRALIRLGAMLADADARPRLAERFNGR